MSGSTFEVATADSSTSAALPESSSKAGRIAETDATVNATIELQKAHRPLSMHQRASRRLRQGQRLGQ
ncbi:hypothetical protein Taro_035828 [Colocasia esculenta]|uniref:Uncharacterized protein n=1 Tax=Colocasia esculenta TaxID=4460 RepID=A0A843WEE3_COLES|nr:hypothetical protein [Colocasia esculenta]